VKKASRKEVITTKPEQFSIDLDVTAPRKN
jgi:hypothetical protein